MIDLLWQEMRGQTQSVTYFNDNQNYCIVEVEEMGKYLSPEGLREGSTHKPVALQPSAITQQIAVWKQSFHDMHSKACITL